ncbi:MAG: GNAT family N-acetyltransferase [Solirubrobacterales bacterium]|nr:GNAT family N-acetyltransferase [Solirubrobacterales bacterium]
MPESPPGENGAHRARAWRTSTLARICDMLEPWEHGTVARASRYPSYYSYNLVRMEDEAPVTAATLFAVADRALAGLAHRRVDLDSAALGQRLRAEFEADGWRSTRVLWMRHEEALPAGPDVLVEDVDYDAVHELRVIWNHEDELGEQADSAFYRYAREVALALGARVVAVLEEGRPIAFAQIQSHGGGAEISDVFVHPEHRGRGLGTAVTRAAIRAAGGSGDLWITADDEDRPKHLYARLGFRPAWTSMEFTRLPRADPGAQPRSTSASTLSANRS